MRFPLIVVAVCLVVLLVDIAGAEVPATKPEEWGSEQGGDIPLLSPEGEARLDKGQEQATTLLYDVASYLDSFFDDGRFVEEENESRATLKLSTGYSRNDKFEIRPRLDVRLKLPRLSSRANLILEASEDSDFGIEDTPTDRSNEHEDAEASEFRAALRFFLKESDVFNVAFDAGGSWDYLYGSLRIRALQDFNSWLGRFTNRLRWYTDDGWENRVSYDLESQLSEDFFFRATSRVNYYEDKDGFPHSQTFKLYEVLSAIRAISYEVSAYMETEPSYKLSDLRFIVRHRQRFYRDWLMLEISPRISFPEDHDREINPGIVFTLEASFGNNADEESFRKVFK